MQGSYSSARIVKPPNVSRGRLWPPRQGMGLQTGRALPLQLQEDSYPPIKVLLAEAVWHPLSRPEASQSRLSKGAASQLTATPNRPTILAHNYVSHSFYKLRKRCEEEFAGSEVCTKSK